MKEKTLFIVGEELKVTNIDPLPGRGIAPPLSLDERCVVESICLDKAGNQHLNVGLRSKYNFIRSHETGEELPSGDTIHWCHPSRFVKA